MTGATPRAPMPGATRDYPIALFDPSLVGSPVFYGGTHVDVMDCGRDRVGGYYVFARIGKELGGAFRPVTDAGQEKRIHYTSMHPAMRTETVEAALLAMGEYTVNDAGYVSWTEAGLLKYVGALFVAQRTQELGE